MLDKAENSDLEAIKKLMIMQLVTQGVKQGDIALALDISDATLSKMFPKGALKALRGTHGA